jgi:hypothetical protein
MFVKMKPVVPPVRDLRMVIGDPLMDSLHRHLNWGMEEEIEVPKRKARVLLGEFQLISNPHFLADEWIVKITVDS